MAAKTITTTSALFILLTQSGLIASAESVSLNEDWRFMRLSDETAAKWTAGQQGTDWSSQFNVQYADASADKSGLALSEETLRAEAAQCADGSRWEKVELPHTAKVEDYVIKQPWQGVCCYKRALTLTEAQAAGRAWLEFEGAMQLADVWINGRHAAQHAGGFTSFVVDGSGLLRAGENEIVVRLDNRDNQLIPPGKSLSKLDFCYHSGLYRDVRLICKGDVHVTHPLLSRKQAGGGVFVTFPSADERNARVRVQTEAENSGGAPRDVKIRQTLHEWSREKGVGAAVASVEERIALPAGTARTLTQEIDVREPRLWHPDSPNLYVLRTEILDGDALLDREDTRIGIRRFEVTRDGCRINGRPVYLEGTNRHQEYPYVGNAISDNAQRRDVWQMRRNGFNTVRLGHYPQDPAFLDACDELGLLAIEPIPGWQFFNRDPRFTEQTYENVREMIRRDRNHPSILLWETTLNESWPPAEWKDGAVAVAHAEMPGDQCFTSGDSYGYSGFDVCYNDWRDSDFSRPNNSSKPGFIREYYDYEFGGHYSTSRVTRGDGEKALRQNLWNAQWSHNSNRSRSNDTMGGAVWSMYDYNRGCCDNICYSGVADLFRLPKYSLSYYRSQIPVGAYTPEGPMPAEVFIASRWDENSPDSVVVLGNVAEVALVVNGEEIARKRPDDGPDTPYVPAPDGGNVSTLAFPPFTFAGVKFRHGELKAVGYGKDGKKIAEATVRTPGAPATLRVSYFEGGTPAATQDLLIVYAALTDADGNPCHANGTPVTLETEGAEIVGPSTVNSEDGVASFIVRTGKIENVRACASAGELKGTAEWRLLKPASAK